MEMNGIIGHRGCAGHAPENTLAGLRDAARMGLKWVEVDATLLKDGEVVLFHDDTLDRCTDHTGFIRDQNWSDIVSIDAGRWFGKGQFVGERIPRLGDALKCVESLGIGLNLELKIHQDEGESLAENVAAMLKKHSIDSLVVSSFDLNALRTFRSFDKTTKLGLLYDNLPEDWFDVASELHAYSVHLWRKYISKDIIDNVRGNGLKAFVFTVNEKENAHSLFEMGIDGIFSDFPDRI